MKIVRDRYGVSLAIMLAVSCLLPVLAILQYRWIGQVSEAERERMQTNLRTAVARFRQDFNGELTHAFVALQFGRAPFPERDLRGYADRYEHWREVSSNRDLVLNYFVTQGGEAGTSELLVLNPQTGRFVPVQWPERLAGLRVRLQKRLEESGRRPRMGPGGPVIDAELPALVAPRLRAMPGRELPPPDRLGRRTAQVIGWSIVELNQQFIRNELVPELIQKYFARPGGLDYYFQIVSRSDPRKVIFQSDPKLSAGFFSSPDAVANILEVMPEARMRTWGPGIPRFEATGEFPPMIGPPERFQRGRGYWQLLVKHRLGSLESAVDQARQRNLGVSFAILLLMGVSIVMLVISTRRAQRLARLQMQFVAGVSHELRTPLAIICSAADNLADGLVAKTEQVKRYGTVIRKEGRRLTEMVEQVLGFTGAQAGQLNIHLQPVEISGVIDSALAACEPALSESGCRVEKHVQPNLPAVMADSTSLSHCFRNLLSNALKYGGDGKWIGIRAESVNGGQGAELQIRIEDKGPGIDPEDRPHIFEPFYRGRKVNASRIRGAGLGLSIVNHVMEAHHGTVDVTSSPGKGTCFTLRIPLTANPVERIHES